LYFRNNFISYFSVIFNGDPVVRYAHFSLILILFILLSCSGTKDGNSDDLKIIALSPGIVETIFFLGKGDNIIGTSGHCSFPEKARSIPVVAGISDLNLEFVLKEKPDIVFLMPSQKNISEKLDLIGIKNITVPQETLADILNSFVVIGEEIGLKKRSETIKDSLDSVLNLFQAQEDSSEVLISVGREYGSPVSHVYSNGKTGFLNDIMILLGHKNALDTSIPYPKVGTEAIMTIDPDIIIDLVPETAQNEEELLRDWETFKMNKAWKESKIHIFIGSHTTIPGPRIFDFIKELKEKGL